jgi:hypothetical protein
MKNISILISLLFLSIILISTSNNAHVSRLDSANLTTNNSVISPLKVDIINLPQKNWLERNAVLITCFIGILGVLFGASIAYLFQKRILNIQLSLQKKNDWINNFRNIISELLSCYFNIFDKFLYNKNYTLSMYKIRPSKTEIGKYEDKINFYKRLLGFYLDEHNCLHNKLQNSLNEVSDIFNKLVKERNDSYSREIVMEKINICFENSKTIIEKHM